MYAQCLYINNLNEIPLSITEIKHKHVQWTLRSGTSQ